MRKPVGRGEADINSLTLAVPVSSSVDFSEVVRLEGPLQVDPRQILVGRRSQTNGVVFVCGSIIAESGPSHSESGRARSRPSFTLVAVDHLLFNTLTR